MSLDPGYILANILVSGIGFVLCSYGRKRRRNVHFGIGLVMLVYPYVITDVPLMLVVAALLLGLLWLLTRLGM
jgi:hypothetical protein